MRRKRIYLIAGTAVMLFLSVYLSAQVRDPGISRSWWPALREYIRGKTSSKMVAFVHSGTPTDRIVAVFTPHTDITVQRIDVYAKAKVDSDSTAVILSNGILSAQAVLDSAGAAQYWYDSTEVQFTALLPCTVKFSDDNFSGTFVTGADTPMVVLQYRVSD